MANLIPINVFDIDEAIRLKAKALGIEFTKSGEMWIQAKADLEKIKATVDTSISQDLESLKARSQCKSI
jgi:hypothetical protein